MLFCNFCYYRLYSNYRHFKLFFAWAVFGRFAGQCAVSSPLKSFDADAEGA